MAARLKKNPIRRSLREQLHASIRSINQKSMTAEGWRWRTTILTHDLQCLGKRTATQLERTLIQACSEDILHGRVCPHDLHLAAQLATPGSAMNKNAVVMGVLEGVSMMSTRADGRRVDFRGKMRTITDKQKFRMHAASMALAGGKITVDAREKLALLRFGTCRIEHEPLLGSLGCSLSRCTWPERLMQAVVQIKEFLHPELHVVVVHDATVTGQMLLPISGRYSDDGMVALTGGCGSFDQGGDKSMLRLLDDGSLPTESLDAEFQKAGVVLALQVKRPDKGLESWTLWTLPLKAESMKATDFAVLHGTS